MALPIAFGQMVSARNKERVLKRTIKNAPKYEIQDEAFDNQAIARGEAYGRDRSIQMRGQEMEQEAANAVADAKDVTTGTSSLLSTISAIKANQDATGRQLAGDEAMLQAQKKSQLLNVNQQMIDEKDKAWNYNVNMPYQMKVAQLRDRIKFAREQQAQQFAASSNFMTNMFAGGGFNWQPQQGQDQGAAGSGPIYSGTSPDQSGGGMMKGMGQSGMKFF